MTINARAKGQRGEREVVKLLQPVVNRVYAQYGLAVVDLERNLMQSLKGGYDIIGLDWLALEVKRHEKVSHGMSGMEGWWTQTVRQAVDGGREPVLVYRPNSTAWRVQMLGYLCVGANGGYRVKTKVDIDLQSFMLWFDLKLNRELASRGHTPLPPGAA